MYVDRSIRQYSCYYIILSRALLLPYILYYHVINIHMYIDVDRLYNRIKTVFFLFSF